MNKLVSAFVVGFFLLSVVSSIFDGGGTGTTMTANLVTADEAASITVVSTDGFLTTGIIFIGNEKILHANTDATHFLGLTRGYENTPAKAHLAGSMVYTEDAGVVNAALGFNPAAVAVKYGFWSAVVIPWNFFTITMPKLMLWDFGFFTGDLLLFRYVLMIVSIGFYITFAIQLGTTIADALRIT